MQPIITCKKLGKSYRIGKYNHRSIQKDISDFVNSLIKPRKLEQNSEEYIWALKNIDFTVNKGDCVGIIGKNGSGKSTLLKVLTGLTEPTEGDIRVNGKVASLLEVGTGFDPELTGRENVFLNAAILGMSIDETNAKFEEIVKFSGVEKFIDTPVKRYSSGMLIRLAFSIATHITCDILVLDEVLGVGDVFFQEKSLARIKSLIQQEGLTSIIVSHDQKQMMDLCNKLILLENGTIKEISTPHQVMKTYLQPPSLDEKIKCTVKLNEDLEVHSFSFQNHNKKETPNNTITQGLPFYFCFTVNNRSEKVHSLDFQVIIKNMSVGNIAFFGNNFQKSDFIFPPNLVKRIMLKFQPIFITEGQYNVDIYLDHSTPLTKNANFQHKVHSSLNIEPLTDLNSWNHLPKNNELGFSTLVCTEVIED